MIQAPSRLRRCLPLAAAAAPAELHIAAKRNMAAGTKLVLVTVNALTNSSEGTSTIR